MTVYKYLSLLILPFVLAVFASAGSDVVGLDKAASTDQTTRSSESMAGWRLLRTRNPRGGPDAISITHTVDTSRSDLDFAGLMIRCSERGTEAVVVLVRAFPLNARLQVVFGKPAKEIAVGATVAPPGTSILISADTASLINSTWRGQDDLFIRVDDGHTTTRGVVPLAGLQAGFQLLERSCLER